MYHTALLSSIDLVRALLTMESVRYVYPFLDFHHSLYFLIHLLTICHFNHVVEILVRNCSSVVCRGVYLKVRCIFFKGGDLIKLLPR